MTETHFINILSVRILNREISKSSFVKIESVFTTGIMYVILNNNNKKKYSVCFKIIIGKLVFLLTTIVLVFVIRFNPFT